MNFANARARYLFALGAPALALAPATACRDRDEERPTMTPGGANEGAMPTLPPPTVLYAGPYSGPLLEPPQRPGQCPVLPSDYICTPGYPRPGGAELLAPFDQCSATLGARPFSPRHTWETRRTDATRCCYVNYRDCGVPVPGRALRAPGGPRAAGAVARDDWG